MSSVLSAKRATESLIGSSIEFRLGANRETAAPVEVHLAGVEHLNVNTRLGSGPTHHEALADACERKRETARRYLARRRQRQEAWDKQMGTGR